MTPFEHMSTALTGRSPWPFMEHPATKDDKTVSKTDRLRNYLRTQGAANAFTLADEADVPQTALVGALLKGDIAKGRVIFRGDKYHWNHQFDEAMHKRLQEAAALLRANGFTVIRTHEGSKT